jgi:hypothetical protein
MVSCSGRVVLKQHTLARFSELMICRNTPIIFTFFLPVPVIVIGVTMTVECTVDDVAGIGADARSIRLDFVRDVEAVNVHEPALDSQIGINQFVQVHLHFQVPRLDPVNGIGSRTKCVQLVQLFATDGVSLVAERVLDGFDASSQVHLRQVESDERVGLKSGRVDDPTTDEWQRESRWETGRRQGSKTF